MYPKFLESLLLLYAGQYVENKEKLIIISHCIFIERDFLVMDGNKVHEILNFQRVDHVLRVNYVREDTYLTVEHSFDQQKYLFTIKCNENQLGLVINFNDYLSSEEELIDISTLVENINENIRRMIVGDLLKKEEIYESNHMLNTPMNSLPTHRRISQNNYSCQPKNQTPTGPSSNRSPSIQLSSCSRVHLPSHASSGDSHQLSQLRNISFRALSATTTRESSELTNGYGSSRLINGCTTSPAVTMYESSQLRNGYESSQLANEYGSSQLRNGYGTSAAVTTYGPSQLTNDYVTSSAISTNGLSNPTYAYGTAENFIFYQQNECSCFSSNSILFDAGNDSSYYPASDNTLTLDFSEI